MYAIGNKTSRDFKTWEVYLEITWMVNEAVLKTICSLTGGTGVMISFSPQ